jgi:hypothetical protein
MLFRRKLCVNRGRLLVWFLAFAEISPQKHENLLLKGRYAADWVQSDLKTPSISNYVYVFIVPLLTLV